MLYLSLFRDFSTELDRMQYFFAIFYKQPQVSCKDFYFFKRKYFVSVCKELNLVFNFFLKCFHQPTCNIRRLAKFKPILLRQTRLQGWMSQFDKYLTSIVSEQLLLCLDDWCKLNYWFQTSERKTKNVSILLQKFCLIRAFTISLYTY